MTETKLKLADWLDDLSVRFIINLPIEELVSVERICFQIEEAHWFYEDFLRPLDPALPNMHLKPFCNLMFHHCPLLGNIDTVTAAKAYDEFLAYKQRVPVRGAILLNDDMTEVVLVRGLKKSARWSFPRGKINKEETDFDCAIREVYEETGFDVRAAGLDDEDTVRSVDLSIRDQQMKMYMIRGVPMDTHFAPRTRGEIGDIKWFKLSDLPTNRNKHHQAQQQQAAARAPGVYNDNMFYVVAPFLNPLKNWIKQQRKLDKGRARAVSGYATAGTDLEDAGTADEGAIVSGNDTAYEDTLAPLPVQPADGHFDGLLAGLRNSSTVTPKAAPQEMPTEQSPMDPAAALKKMLSVGGGAPTQPPPPTQSNASALLSIFNGGRVASQPIPPAGPHIPPHTPLNQIVNVPPQPRSPTHHNQAQRPHVATSAQGPPPYPFTPVSQQFPQQNFAYQAQSFHPQQNHPGHHASISNTAPIPTSRGPPYPHTAGPPTAPQGFSQGPAPHHVQGGPQPFHRIGDPQFTQMPFEDSGARAVPSASQLPLPKLNNHSMNLLRAFTSGESKPRIEDTAQRAAETYNKRIAEQRSVTSPVDQLARSLAALTSAKSPQNNPSVPVMSPDQAPSQPQHQQQGSKHQDSLLSLFRTPSTSIVAPAAPPPIKVPQGPEPIELSAQPSPGFPSVARAQAGGPVRQTYASKLGVPPTNASANVKPGLTSATISGPLNAPDFGKFKQKNRTSPSAGLNGAGLPASVLGGTTSFSPVSILKRPQAADAGLLAPKSPPVPVHTVSPKTVLEQPAPRPFKPQILKRSQQTPSPAPVAQKQSKVPPQPQQMVQQQQSLTQQPISQQYQPPIEQQQLPSQHQQHHQQQMAPPVKPSLQHPLHAQAPQHQHQHQQPTSSQNPLFDRRTSTQTTQKSSLLSLFNSSPAPTNQSVTTASTAQTSSHQPTQTMLPPVLQPSHPQHAFPGSGIGIMSPISPLPEKMALGHNAGTGAGTGSFNGRTQSRISSLNSTSNPLSTMGLGTGMDGGSFTSAISATSNPGGNVGVAGFGGAMGRQSVSASASASARGSAQHTPVTPVDRSFLLGYLQGVVEQAKK